MTRAVHTRNLKALIKSYAYLLVRTEPWLTHTVHAPIRQCLSVRPMACVRERFKVFVTGCRGTNRHQVRAPYSTSSGSRRGFLSLTDPCRSSDHLDRAGVHVVIAVASGANGPNPSTGQLTTPAREMRRDRGRSRPRCGGERARRLTTAARRDVSAFEPRPARVSSKRAPNQLQASSKRAQTSSSSKPGPS